MFPKPSPRTVLYIAGAYTATKENPSVHHNMNRAWEVGFKWVKRGYGVIIPHCNTLHMEPAADYQHFIEMTLELLRRSDAVVMCQGWRESNGATGEYEEALKLGLPIHEEGNKEESNLDFIW